MYQILDIVAASSFPLVKSLPHIHSRLPNNFIKKIAFFV